MVKHHHHHDTNNGKGIINITTDPNLVNFHFSTPAPVTTASSTVTSSRPRSGSLNHTNNKKKGSNNNNNHHHHHHRRTAEDRASSRKKAMTQMFPLHSSSDHAFVISRVATTTTTTTTSTNQNQNSNNNNNSIDHCQSNHYTFQGPDRPVSWESVRIVKCFTPMISSEENDDNIDPYYNYCNDGITTTTSSSTSKCNMICPICLDDSICSRITKCGHVFCYICILYHIQTYTDKTTIPKCPCCSIPIYTIYDLRPIQIIPITIPSISTTRTTTIKRNKVITNNSNNNIYHTKQSTKMRFIKLHRTKHCSSPYIPLYTEPRRCSPYAIPCYQQDKDAIYCKFNYINCIEYIKLLQQNLIDLQQEYTKSNMTIMDDMVYGLAIQIVQDMIQSNMIPKTISNHNNNNCSSTSPNPTQAIVSVEREIQLQEQYENIASGFYCQQIPSLIYHPDMIYQHNNDLTNTKQQCQQQQYSTDSSNNNNDNEYNYNDSATLSAWDHDTSNYNNNLDRQQTMDNDASPIATTTLTNEESTTIRQRDRGDSITSYTSYHSIESNHHYHDDSNNNITKHSKHQNQYGGSMYATDDEYTFYQAEDGSLCFLSSFNINCLHTEFSTTLPSSPSHAVTNEANLHTEMEALSVSLKNRNSNNTSQSYRSPKKYTIEKHHNDDIWKPPLPDIVEGYVVEIERVQLTPEMRERRRFLSHIPLYTDICFVEINLNYMLSSQTKKVFKKEFTKRQQIRMAREKAEREEDEMLQLQEQERINERKARLQHIDPMDDFFQPIIPPEPDVLSDEFGPTISTIQPTQSTSTMPVVGISFSQVCQAGELIPSIQAAPTDNNFPALGTTQPTTKAKSTMKKAPPPRPWGDSIKVIPPVATSDDAIPLNVHAPTPEVSGVTVTGGGKKNKGKKIVLFSTGAQRSDYF